MRFIIFGVGAIGGTVAVALTRSGTDVVGIARGRQLSAIRADGLTLRSPGGDAHARFECVEDPAQIALRDDDAILLTVKSQDTAGALASLRKAGAVRQPVFCLQNGVANERTALRHFDNVYGVTVMMPSDYVTPGIVLAYGSPRIGIFDIGRYPGGIDETATHAAERFEAAGVATFLHEDVMASKYGKLLFNLANVLDGAFGERTPDPCWEKLAREEGQAAYAAAGLNWTNVGLDDPRRKTLLQIGEIEGVRRIGSSTRQSLVRGTGSIETDYLNGEIALTGRLHGVGVPVNAALGRIGRKLADGTLKPGEVTDADIEAEVAAAR